MSFTESYKKLAGEELKMSHQEFLKSRSKALNEFKNSKQPDKYISQVFSEKGVKTIENIRDILNSAESPEEISAKFVECEQMINTNDFLSKNEKSLLRFQLGFVKAISIEAAKAKIYDKVLLQRRVSGISGVVCFIFQLLVFRMYFCFILLILNYGRLLPAWMGTFLT